MAERVNKGKKKGEERRGGKGKRGEGRGEEAMGSEEPVYVDLTLGGRSRGI